MRISTVNGSRTQTPRQPSEYKPCLIYPYLSQCAHRTRLCPSAVLSHCEIKVQRLDISKDIYSRQRGLGKAVMQVFHTSEERAHNLGGHNGVTSQSCRPHTLPNHNRSASLPHHLRTAPVGQEHQGRSRTKPEPRIPAPPESGFEPCFSRIRTRALL